MNLNSLIADELAKTGRRQYAYLVGDINSTISPVVEGKVRKMINSKLIRRLISQDLNRDKPSKPKEPEDNPNQLELFGDDLNFKTPCKEQSS